MSREKPRKICPRCGLPGSGPYARYVLNAAKKRYEPYSYFAHKSQGKLSWCYLGKNGTNAQLSNSRDSSKLSELLRSQKLAERQPVITQLSNSVDAVGDVGENDKPKVETMTYKAAAKAYKNLRW